MIRKQRRATQRVRCIDGWEIRQAYGIPEVRIVDHKGRPVRVMSANCNLPDRELQRILLEIMEEKR